MKASSRGSRWAWLGPTLLWGIPLGLLQVGIIINGFSVTIVQLNWPESIPLGAALYLLIPTMGAFFNARRHGRQAFEESIAGLRIGACSIFVVSICAVGLLVFAVATPPPPPQPHTFVISRPVAIIAVSLFFLFLIGLNCFGLALASLGGLLGGWLRRRTTSLGERGAVTPVHPFKHP